jgi:hypothetical protein
MRPVYVIYHVRFENTNILTFDESKISEIIHKQANKYQNTTDEWRWRKIIEGEEFEAQMNTLRLFYTYAFDD